MTPLVPGFAPSAHIRSYRRLISIVLRLVRSRNVTLDSFFLLRVVELTYNNDIGRETSHVTIVS